MNKVILTGNLTKSPELRRTQSGKTYVRVGIAVQRKKDAADFFDMVAWGKMAEFISRYFVKGSRIIVEGRLQTNNYTDAKGDKHYSVDVIVEKAEFGIKTASGKAAETTDKDFWQDDFTGEELPEYAMPF
mgnify:CR=1 FL=1